MFHSVPYSPSAKLASLLRPHASADFRQLARPSAVRLADVVRLDHGTRDSAERVSIKWIRQPISKTIMRTESFPDICDAYAHEQL
jgi:hypothetical protein